MTIDVDKLQFDGKPRFSLRSATVYESTDGYTFSKYLDVTDESANRSPLRSDEMEHLHSYIDRQLQYNKERFANLISVVRRFSSDANTRILDVGCGGGEFLRLAKNSGYEVHGIELQPDRAEYSRRICSCEVYDHDITSDYFDRYKNSFDAVSLWDVIEHVNFPYKTLLSIHKVLRPGGVLYIDTPAKDSFYHRFGELTYRVTFGRFPTFLNIMYSEHPFGHKQIFSTKELTAMLSNMGFEILHLVKFHELSFPYAYYLKKMLGSDYLASKLAPLVSLLFLFCRIKNKMLIVARKK
jgi:2-polyprenyl-3-methyl-5-hydroxy-6-metoxy-1,4-benzoquinol methylase